MSSAHAYPQAPDIETASDEYAKRFSGDVGAWFLQVQEEVTLRMLEPYPEATVLDVGGGHGQITKPLVEHGYSVTVLGSAQVCCKQIQDYVDAGRCEFEVGNISNMPFDDESFDIVVSYRTMAHVPEWRSFVRELARVSRECVLVDYPDTRSFNLMKELFFFLKKRVEENARKYRLFGSGSIESEFGRNGMECFEKYRQFFWPMFIHRWAQSEEVSRVAEEVCRRVGLSGVFGSPVIAKFVD